MGRKLFYVIYIKDNTLKTIIDGIRLFADPTQKHKAHLTVRGPYTKFQRQFVEDWNKDLANGKMEISGIGTFFSEYQNTVYLNCIGTTTLRSVWNKKDYPDFNPHITLYNGESKDYANELVNILEAFDFRFQIDADELQILKSPVMKGEYSIYGEPFVASCLDTDLLDEMLDGDMPPLKNEESYSINKMSKDLRFDFIKRLGALLDENTSSNVKRIPKPQSPVVAE